MNSKINEKFLDEDVLNEANLLKLLIRVKNGNFLNRLPDNTVGTKGSIYQILNEIIEINISKDSEINKLTIDNKKEATLRKTNEELKGETVRLTAQNGQTDLKNKVVEEARKLLEEKAHQLALVSKYKSEFLANMSHELRTPLNSLQILAHELIQNQEGNLNEKQIQYAKIIKACGEELIDLINDILDLSKIEAGYLSIEYSQVSFSEIANYIDNSFRHIAEGKHLNFIIETEDSLPEFIETDTQRLYQILKNLLSNAFKFTEKGQIVLKIFKSDHKSKKSNSNFDNAKTIIAFEISDSGIGIAEEKQKIIFEAFQQAEGSTSRKYGGTGLGLSISRGLSQLLGGVIELESNEGHGSKFTLFLPLKAKENVGKNEIELTSKNNLPNFENFPKPYKSLVKAIIPFLENDHTFEDLVGDDRLNIVINDKVILIIDEDIAFAKMIIKKAHHNGMKVIATTKNVEMIDLIMEFRPISIIMNVNCSNKNCWKTMNRVKTDLTLRHIPIYITAEKDNNATAIKLGARNYFLKPLEDTDFTNLFNDIKFFISKKIKKLLVVVNNEIDLKMIVNAIEYDDINITAVKNVTEAINLIQEIKFECIIFDSALFDMIEVETIKQLVNKASGYQTALILYSEKIPNPKLKVNLKQIPCISILKNKHSLGQLVNLTSQFLYRVHEELPEKMRNIISEVYLSDDILIKKNILIVDDDIRNLFVLTNALERYVHSISNAESGEEAISVLEKNSDIDIVLMDIMMPQMDGYETMKRIRKIKKNVGLPIICLTAKAMKGDRQKCIEAGASDYITKPVDVNQLLKLMRVWSK